MRPTRWTRRDRVTYYGKGGWGLSPCPHYTNPVTGHSVVVTSRSLLYSLLRIVMMRRKQERRH